MRLHVIGEGYSDPRSERFGSAFLFDAGEERLLIDFWPVPLAPPDARSAPHACGSHPNQRL